jgi:hypothetical protein
MSDNQDRNKPAIGSNGSSSADKLDNPRPRRVEERKASLLRRLRRKIGGAVADIFTW